MTDNDLDLDTEQEIQEEQYEFPYHYIPEIDTGGDFSQTRQWSWGYRYLGGMRVVFDQLKQFDFDSLADIGCGDGRFLLEVRKRYPEVDLLGIDYSERAIDMANAMNPGIKYESQDIIENSVNEQFEVVTLIEVLEHIPPNKLSEFIESIVEILDGGGILILTVPHNNKPVQDKHYQHFSQKELFNLFERHFDNLDFIPFDKQSRILYRLQKLLGGRGSHYVITNSTIKSSFWRLYTSCYLYTSESKCSRIAMVAKNDT
jgi:SAM-dependent methyltransferase